MNLQEEVWVDVVGYENLYQVSNMARVKSLVFKNHKILMVSKNSSKLCKGNYKVSLVKDGKTRSFMLSLLVAEHHVNNRNSYSSLFFKDNDRDNCEASNLRWIEGTKDRVLSRDKLLKLYERIDKSKWNDDQLTIYKYFTTENRERLSKIYSKYYKQWNNYAKQLSYREDDKDDLCQDLLMISYEGLIGAIDSGRFRFDRCYKDYAVCIYMKRIIRNSYVNWKSNLISKQNNSEGIIFSMNRKKGENVRLAY